MVKPASHFMVRCVLLLVALLALGFLYAGAILSATAVQPVAADAVVVLGGDGEQRYARARELVLNGYSKRLLVIHPSAAVRVDALERLCGVDVQFDTSPTSSWQEAQVARSWLLDNALKSVIVVSDPPHMLRLQYAWGSVFRGTDLTFALVATAPPEWAASRWWANPQSARFVENEVLKLGYYVLRYRFGLF